MSRPRDTESGDLLMVERDGTVIATVRAGVTSIVVDADPAWIDRIAQAFAGRAVVSFR